MFALFNPRLRCKHWQPIQVLKQVCLKEFTINSPPDHPPPFQNQQRFTITLLLLCFDSSTLLDYQFWDFFSSSAPSAQLLQGTTRSSRPELAAQKATPLAPRIQWTKSNRASNPLAMGTTMIQRPTRKSSICLLSHRLPSRSHPLMSTMNMHNHSACQAPRLPV